MKYKEAILSNSTRTLSGFETTKMLIAFSKKYVYCAVYYNFQHTFVPYKLYHMNKAYIYEY